MTDALAALRREVCALHAELPRNGLVAWTSGNISARVPDEDLMVIKASGVSYDDLDPGRDRRVRPQRRPRRGRPAAVERRGDARLRLPRDARRRRRRAHPQRVRDRVGDPRRADPVRHDGDGRRVRRRDPRRPVRADRRRGDRPRRRRDARRPPLARGAHARARRLHGRRERARRREGGGHVRGRRAHGAPRAGARAGRAARAAITSTRSGSATRTSTDSAREDRIVHTQPRLQPAPAQAAQARPRIGLLGVMQSLYDDMLPGIAERQAAYAREVARRAERRRRRRGRAAGQGARGRRARDGRPVGPQPRRPARRDAHLRPGDARRAAAGRDAAADLPGEHPARPGGHARRGTWAT